MEANPMMQFLTTNGLHILTNIELYKYSAIMPLAILEGPILAVICGALIQTGVLHFIPVFACLFVGDIISDTYWYYFGYHGGPRLTKRFAKYISVTEDHLESMKRVYAKHYISILIISKLTTGFGFSPLIVAFAGYTKVPFRKYILINIIAQPFWTCALIALGYYVGGVYIHIKNGLDIVTITAIIIVVAGILYGFIKYIRAQIIKKYL